NASCPMTCDSPARLRCTYGGSVGVVASKSAQVAGVSLAASAVYAAGFYLPVVTQGDDSASISSLQSELVWIFVVPAVVAAIAAVVGLRGRAAAVAGAAGVVTGMAGFTAYELTFMHRCSEEAGDGVS